MLSGELMSQTLHRYWIQVAAGRFTLAARAFAAERRRVRRACRGLPADGCAHQERRGKALALYRTLPIR
jgi:hypothetical protein